VIIILIIILIITLLLILYFESMQCSVIIHDDIARWTESLIVTGSLIVNNSLLDGQKGQGSCKVTLRSHEAGC